jgi:hypothetical protein
MIYACFYPRKTHTVEAAAQFLTIAAVTNIKHMRKNMELSLLLYGIILKRNYFERGIHVT